MAPIILDEHRDRFRSDADFDFIVSLFEAVAKEPQLTPVWAKKRHLATLLSPASAKSLVQDRMLQCILDNPSLLDDVRNRLENEELVD
jgi:hypothetical protein